jgi:hypothetical protein
VYLTVPVEIASIVQLDPTGALAVKSPPAVIVPHLAIHVTGMLAVNCCVFPCGVFAEAGVMTMGDTMSTSAVALPLPLIATAVIWHEVAG